MHLGEHRETAAGGEHGHRSGTDDELAKALDGTRQGEAASLGVLYTRLNPLLLRYLRRRAGAAAPDLASEVWAGLAPEIAGFRGSADDLRALTFTIARRRVADHFRRSARQVCTVPLDESMDAPDTHDVESMAVEALSTEKTMQRLSTVLSHEQAQIVMLRVVAGLEGDRVAAVVGKSAGAVRIAQHRALRSLRGRWEMPERVTR